VGKRDTYALSDDDAPRPRYEPPAESDADAPARRDDPFWVRLMEWDPFPLLMFVVVVLWVGLGLAARRWPAAGLGLAGAGLLVCLLGQLYLYALIFRDDPQHALLSFVSKWYRLVYLHFNIELTLRPTIVTGCGVLMVLTGVFVFLNNAKPPGP
jgi:hypothetical protein